MSHKPGGAVSGTFPSLKLGRAVTYASSVERDFLFFCEFDPDILTYQEQPFCLTGALPDGSIRRYTPDFLLTRREGQELVECKPTQMRVHPHTRQQCILGQAWAAEHDGAFRLVTDEELRTGHTLPNLKRLWRYSRLPIPPREAARCLSLVGAQPGITVADLAARVLPAEPPAAIPLIHALLFHHRLHTDLSQALLPTSCLKLEA
jgi:hypothetical protein